MAAAQSRLCTRSHQVLGRRKRHKLSALFPRLLQSKCTSGRTVSHFLIIRENFQKKGFQIQGSISWLLWWIWLLVGRGWWVVRKGGRVWVWWRWRWGCGGGLVEWDGAMPGKSGAACLDKYISQFWQKYFTTLTDSFICTLNIYIFWRCEGGLWCEGNIWPPATLTHPGWQKNSPTSTSMLAPTDKHPTWCKSKDPRH